MPKIEIMIDGKAYPCRQTMGAMLRFKKETGKEVTEISDSLSDMCAYLYCCTASACKKDGIKFSLSLMDFADSITPEDLNDWTAAVNNTAEQIPDSSEGHAREKKVRHLRFIGCGGR